jgi:hypothetical protein
MAESSDIKTLMELADNIKSAVELIYSLKGFPQGVTQEAVQKVISRLDASSIHLEYILAKMANPPMIYHAMVKNSEPGSITYVERLA